MKILLKKTIDKLEQAHVTHHQRSLKSKSIGSFFDSVPIAFNSYSSIQDHRLSLDKIFNEWEDTLEEMVYPPSPAPLNYMDVFKELAFIDLKLKDCQHWNFNKKKHQLDWSRVKFDKISKDYMDDEEFKKMVENHLKLQELFVGRLIALIKFHVVHLATCLLLAKGDVENVHDLRKKVKKGMRGILLGLSNQFEGEGESGKVVWNQDAVDLTELICALQRTKCLCFEGSRPLNQSEVATYICKVFNFEIGNFRSGLHAAKNRKKGTAVFLTELVESFIRFASQE